MYNPNPPPYNPYAPQPVYHHENTPLHHGSRLEGEMFSPHGWRDLFWAILFILHLSLMVVYVAFGIARDPDAARDQILGAVIPEDVERFKTLLIVCVSAAAFGGVLSFLLLIVVRKFARALIYISMVASIVFSFATAVYFISVGQFIIGGIMIFFTFLSAFLFYAWRSRIPFATAMLETVSRLVDTYSGVVWISYLSIIAQLAWATFWLWSLMYINVFPRQVAWVAFALLLVSFFWTSQVIKNIVHVTTCGTIATWYFMYGVAMPSNPSMGSLKRATTTSFGSICLGSLIVALIRALRQLIQSMRGRDNIVGMIADCLIGILDSLVTYFNHWAFTQVAIYGKSYIQAARDTWTLIKSEGIEAIINDNIISNVLWLSTLCGSVLCAVFSGVLGYFLLRDYWGSCAVLGLFVGYIMIAMTMEVIESSVASLFVCFAMDQLALARNDPILYQRFKDTYSGIYRFSA